MDNQIQIEVNGNAKYLPTKDADSTHVTPMIYYGTRKSSRRLNQVNLNSDFILDNSATLNHLTNLKDSNLKDNLIQQSNNDHLAVSKKDISSVNSNNATTNQTSSANQQNHPNINNSTNRTITMTVTKQRKWEQWQIDDTKWFFEALNEHGKDFNAIHNYMVHRSKKKGIAEELIKNKEQIRCYFNRQWNKICSIFECNEEEQEICNLEKTTKQLYALINYGEMWKKNNFKNDLKIDAKFKAHLNELVFKGYTFLKIGKKGKNIKLKTPICKALKKIYYFENIYKSINQNLPKDIQIELIPATNYAWMKVHSLAQNPRVRIKCSLQKRLSILIKYLDERWTEQKYNNLQIESLTNECNIKSPKSSSLIVDKINEKFEEKSDNTISSNSKKNLINSSNIDPNLTKNLSKKVFKVKPHPTHHKNLTGLKFTRIQPVPFNSQMDISLSAYLLKANNSKQITNEQKKKGKNLNVNCSKNAKSSNCKEDSSEELKTSPLNNHSEKSNTSHVLETVRELNLLNNIVSSNYKESFNFNRDLNKTDLNENQNEHQNEPENKYQNEYQNYYQTNNQIHEEKSFHLPDPPPNATIAEWLGANNINSSFNKFDQPNKPESIKETVILKETTYKEESKEEFPKEQNVNLKKNESQDQQESIYNRMKKIVDPSTVKNGWSSDEIEDLTIGELYLMLKKPNKIVLQYDWNILQITQNNQESNENAKDLKNSHQSNKNYSSLVSKLITAITFEVMSLNKDKGTSCLVDIDTEFSDKNSSKNNRKTKKLKTNHLTEDNQQQVEATVINEANSNDPISLANPSNDLDNKTGKNQTDKFAIPSNPVPKPANKQNKGRIVNEQLLQEAKEQLNNVKFISTRRNIRKPGMMKQQQIQLNLNSNQLLGNNICQLFTNQGAALTTVPVNVSTVPVNVSSASNGQTALISVITQMNQNNSAANSLQTINIDGSNTTAIQINNATTLNGLCTFVTNTTKDTNSNEMNSSNCVNNNNGVILNNNGNLNDENINHQMNQQILTGNQCLNGGLSDISSNLQTVTENNSIEEKNQQQFANLNQVDPNNLQSSANDIQLDPVGMSLNNNLSMNNNLTMNNSDDKSVNFSNLLDISLSESIFNDTSLQFPSDVSIDSSFAKDHDQTLNTPIKILQKSTINHNTNSFTSQLGLFDSNLGNSNLCNNNLESNNRPETTSFSDGWINNLGADLSLSNIFDCTSNEQGNFRNFGSTSFKDKKDELFNTDFESVLSANRLNVHTDNSSK